jgi:hypothetical protein
MMTNTTGPRLPFHAGFFFKASIFAPLFVIISKMNNKLNRIRIFYQRTAVNCVPFQYAHEQRQDMLKVRGVRVVCAKILLSCP